MEKPQDILDIAPEEFNGELSQEQEQVIEDFKSGFDWDSEKSTPDDDPEKKKKPDEETPSEDDEETKPKDDENPGEKPPSKEPGKKEGESEEGGKKPGEEENPPDDETEEEKLRRIAEEEGITVDEAKEVIEKDKSIVERHGNDPLKIARALRKEQSQYGKLKGENDKLVQFKNEIEAKQVKFQEETFNRKCEANKEKLVEVYLKRHPDEEDAGEEILFERAKVEAKEAMKAKEAEYNQDIADRAGEKIETLISELPEGFKEFIPEIKEVANDVDRHEVLKDTFDIMHIAYWARGKKYSPEYVDSLIKAAEKRAKEEPRIKEQKSHPSSERGGGKTAPVVLSETEKERARDIYGNREGWSEEKMFAEYAKDHKGKDSWD